MATNRREFLKSVGWLGAVGAGVVGRPSTASASSDDHAPPARHGQGMGVLVDTTVCVGCRLCERACQEVNELPTNPIDFYTNPDNFVDLRRPMPSSYTVVNTIDNADDPDHPTHVKLNCMHCLYPACASACIVGALKQEDNGAVTYDAWKCIGCRYCMVACPFQLPSYEYDNAFTPQIAKCQFCFNEKVKAGGVPVCVATCPAEAMTFGRREDLLTLAHERIATRSGQYVDHVYGEHEVGGTSWLYIASRPFEQLNLKRLGPAPPPALTEKIQHGVFKYWLAPVGIFSGLAVSMWRTGMHRRAQVAAAEHHAAHDHAAPVDAKLLTPGVWALIAVVGVGLLAMLYRFTFGLAAATNLDQQNPWGLWIAMDVGSGIALAGGGFVTAALVHIFHREHYHAVARSALLTALLGYTFYVPGLLADLGRWYNLWHPILPNMWQVNSVLFEVGICVMLYLTVQYAELTPIICQRLLSGDCRGRLGAVIERVHRLLTKIMPVLLIFGVTLSCFHQSSLGNLMVIAPYKLHELWWSPVMPALFLLSAIMAALPMVIFTILAASWSLSREPEMHVLTPLARLIPPILAVYLVVKVGDVIWRGVAGAVLTEPAMGALWLVEVVVGAALPMILLASARVRQSPRLLAIACLMVILGVVLNRLNVFIMAYHPPFAQKTYVPSLIEITVSLGLVAALMLVYRIAVTYLPILDPRPKVTR